ncbi:hypothetical protein [Mucilaginibacter polytrichastri]|uniref:Type II secretion system protein GspC N-terminal domain-containing protein n=1 Tax=Mucilaginibacter polytrichastri TaxID=1302689 RepID=A0A1Q5ZZT8_9SPHI|nr:hypothetical protein [Mucilaginibacter polytrichastri]OKS87284.1 hypothetical protein RG47T_2743 [Mucilaginibacter polytrichastri]SFT18526.1 hypothetical protein SAMN04487890_11517 [Mucilaginibacter polytrichastri]
MKNKPVTYFLIAAVIGLWGIIIYRIVDATGSNEDLSISNNAILPRKKALEDYTNMKDTTHLLLNYRNPFDEATKKEEQEIPVAKLINQAPVNHIAPAKVSMNWSFITYTGYIRNSKSKQLLAIVNIRGVEYMMAEGETDAQVKLVKNLRDSIKITFGGQSKFIAMNTK